MRMIGVAGMLLVLGQAAQAQQTEGRGQQAPPPIVLPVSPPPVLAMPAPKPPMPPVAVTKPKPLTNPGTWFSPDDYPIPALMNDAEGQVVFSVHVSKTGVPVDCQVTYTASPFLGAPTCELAMQRGKFAPGRDEKNRPVASAWIGRITWIFPTEEEGKRVFLEPRGVVSRMLVGGGGRLLGCTGSSAYPLERARVCSRVANSWGTYFAPLWAHATDEKPSQVAIISGLSVDGFPEQMPGVETGDGLKWHLTARVAFTIGPDGSVSDCRETERRGDIAMPATLLCETLPAGVHRIETVPPGGAKGPSKPLNAAVWLIAYTQDERTK